MKVIDLQTTPVHQWTGTGKLQSAFTEPAPTELFQQDNVRKQLDMYVSRWQEILRGLSQGASELESFRKQTQAESRLSGLESLTDEQLLNESDRLAMLAEDALDWQERFDARIRDLENVRDLVGVWSEDAERLLSEFRRHQELFAWLERALRNWSEESGCEYDRRHPDVNDLPFTPVDMGPTNSARLPPVL